MELYEKHASLRDRFEIFAFHDPSVKSFEELDPRLEELAADRWGGASLPFPILLDPTGETIDALGITSFPTLLLVGPDGKVVRGANQALFAAKLAALRARRARDGPGEEE